MKKSSKKLPRDPAQRAKAVFDMAVGDVEPEPEEPSQKDPNAVALSRKGGLKGGKARAANMTVEERFASALDLDVPVR